MMNQLAPSSLVFLSMLSCSGKTSSSLQYTDCILTTASSDIPTDIYEIQSLTASPHHGQFTKSMTVYGITLVAKDDVSDAFLQTVGQAIVEIFPSDAEDPSTQQEIIQNLHRYNALIPVFAGGEAGIDPQAIESIPGDHSICDIIMSDTDGGQVMEVVEHLLHMISNVGLHYSHLDQWGLSNQSALYLSMQEAISSGIYNTTDYQSIDEEHILQRILLQEYAYWIISSHWDLQTEYGPNDGFEWKATTPQQLQDDLPSAHTLIQSTIAKTMASPSAETLSILEGYEAASN